MPKSVSGDAANFRFRRASQTPRTLSALFLPRSSVVGHFPDRYWYKYSSGDFPSGPKSYPEMRLISDPAESRRLRAHFPHRLEPIRSVFGHSPEDIWYKYHLGDFPNFQKSYSEALYFRFRRVLQTPRSLSEYFSPIRSVFGHSPGIFRYKYSSVKLPVWQKSYPKTWSISDPEESRKPHAHLPQCFAPTRSVFGHFPDRCWYKYSIVNFPICPK